MLPLESCGQSHAHCQSFACLGAHAAGLSKAIQILHHATALWSQPLLVVVSHVCTRGG